MQVDFRPETKSTHAARELLKEALQVQQTLSTLLDQVQAMLARSQRLTQELEQKSESTASAHGIAIHRLPRAERWSLTGS